MVGRVVFLRLCLVGRDTNKKVTITRPKGSCRKAQTLWELRGGAPSLEQWRWILVGFQEEMTSKLMLEE